MKSFLTIFTSIFLCCLNCMGQDSKTKSEPKMPYEALINKSIPAVMKELKLNNKDTIGKTGILYLQERTPESTYFYIKLKDETMLGFRDNKLSAVVPGKQ